MEHESSLLLSKGPSNFPYPELDQFSQSPASYFLKVSFSITLPSKPRSFKLSLSFGFLRQNPVFSFSFSHMCCISCPCYSFWFNNFKTLSWELQIMKLLNTHSSPFLHHRVPFETRISSSAPFSQTPFAPKWISPENMPWRLRDGVDL